MTIPGQLEMAVPPSPGAKASLSSLDVEREYRRLMGTAATERQKHLSAVDRLCTCDVENPKAPAEMHEPHCRRKPLRFGRQRWAT